MSSRKPWRDSLVARFFEEINPSHIVVTVPKKEYETSDREDELLRKGDGAFWTLSRQPQKIVIGKSRLYFLMRGKIDSSMRIYAVSSGSAKCELTGRMWCGNCILHLFDFRDEDICYPVKGFRGFRYLYCEEDKG